MHNGLVINNSVNMGFGDSHFRGDETSSFRGNIFKHTKKISCTRLSFIKPSINTISRTDSVVFITWHASASNFTPSTMNIGGTEITRLNSQTHFIVRKILKMTRGIISKRSVDDFSDDGMLCVSTIRNSGVLHNQSGLRSIRGSFGLGSKVLIKSHSFGGNW